MVFQRNPPHFAEIQLPDAWDDNVPPYDKNIVLLLIITITYQYYSILSLLSLVLFKHIVVNLMSDKVYNLFSIIIFLW